MACDIRWAAGLFEGEGCVFKRSQDGYWGIALAMTDEPLVHEFRRVMGYGKVYGPYINRPGTKPCWRWQVAAQGAVRLAAKRLLPHVVGEKRAKLQEVSDAHT